MQRGSTECFICVRRKPSRGGGTLSRTNPIRCASYCTTNNQIVKMNCKLLRRLTAAIVEVRTQITILQEGGRPFFDAVVTKNYSAFLVEPGYTKDDAFSASFPFFMLFFEVSFLDALAVVGMAMTASLSPFLFLFLPLFTTS